MTNEYGGYIQLDTYHGREYYPDLLALNSGRAALRFLIRLHHIRKLYLPAFCCSSVREACAAEQIAWEDYPVDLHFRPVLSGLPPQAMGEGEWLYVVNFYGTLPDREILALSRRYPFMIADYIHAFFQKPLPGIPTLYSCRKFFGVPDGAYLSLGLHGHLPVQKALDAYHGLPIDRSCERMHFLLGRFEGQASDFYAEYAANDGRFTREPVKQMSKLTRNFLRAIDYEDTKKRRSENYAFLHQRLQSQNLLSLPLVPGAYAYPFWPCLDRDMGPGPENAGFGKRLRRELIARKIYIPTLWTEVLESCPYGSPEYRMAENILPLPIDQRYTIQDMEAVLTVLLPLLEAARKV